MHLLFRLHWNIFGVVNDITIATWSCDQKATAPLFDHVSVLESLAGPPLGHAEVGIGECFDKRDRDRSPDDFPFATRYQPLGSCHP